MSGSYSGRRILVTGGTGSIGSVIVKSLLQMKPEVVRILSRDETRQYEMQHEVGARADMRYLIGDIRDEQRLKRAMEGVDVVFHAAALKHVPGCEYNPFEAVCTNVQGTQNVINAALDAKVKKVIAISTDKAVNPVNVMGATKLLAEKLIVTANNWIRDVRFCCVRFGNVLGTRGSIVPTFAKQIEQGGPVTITDPKMTRFMMTIEDAIALCLEAGEMCKGGEIFTLKMPSLLVSDLVEVLVETLAPRYGHDPELIVRQLIGARPGEKKDEELLSEDEATRVDELERMLVVKPLRLTRTVTPPDEAVPRRVYHSGEADWLEHDAIREMLARAGCI